MIQEGKKFLSEGTARKKKRKKKKVNRGEISELGEGAVGLSAQLWWILE